MSSKFPGRASDEAMPADLYQAARRRLLSNWPLRSVTARPGVQLTESETRVLESVGLSTAPWASDPDPIRQSIADYMALLETSWTVGQVAKSLKVDVSRIRQRIRERSLYGIEYESEYRLPRFQFERHQVLPGLRDILRELPENLSALDVAQWFLAPNPDLEVEGTTLSPRDWLLRGGATRAVVELARGFE